jgi:hypothetical protein
MLPDGRHFLYLALNPAGSPNDPANRVCVGSLDGGQAKSLVPAYSNAQYAEGYLLFIRGDQNAGTLLAQPFDPVRFTIDGTPVTVAEHVEVTDDLAGFGKFSVAAGGALVFDGSRLLTRLEWYDRAGRQSGTFGEPALRSDPRLSPDGARIAFSKYDPRTQTTQVWTADVPRAVETRLTSGPSSNWAPVWSPDGTRVAFRSDAKHQTDIYVRLADGSGGEEAITDGDGEHRLEAWSSDGRILVAADREPGGQRMIGIFGFRLDGDRKSFMVVPRRADHIVGTSLSQDQRWLAYDAEESGRREVFVVSFPDGRGKVQISNAGGLDPKWTRNGRELLYRTYDQQMMSVVVDTSQGFNAAPARPLFTVPEGAMVKWDVSADGQRFVFAVPVLKSSSVALSYVQQWAAGLNR